MVKSSFSMFSIFLIGLSIAPLARGLGDWLFFLAFDAEGFIWRFEKTSEISLLEAGALVAQCLRQVLGWTYFLCQIFPLISSNQLIAHKWQVQSTTVGLGAIWYCK
jgi:hypothetical protein